MKYLERETHHDLLSSSSHQWAGVLRRMTSGVYKLKYSLFSCLCTTKAEGENGTKIDTALREILNFIQPHFEYFEFSCSTPNRLQSGVAMGERG